jgi:hypothetical protein
MKIRWLTPVRLTRGGCANEIVLASMRKPQPPVQPLVKPRFDDGR